MQRLVGAAVAGSGASRVYPLGVSFVELGGALVWSQAGCQVCWFGGTLVKVKVSHCLCQVWGCLVGATQLSQMLLVVGLEVLGRGSSANQGQLPLVLRLGFFDGHLL